MDRIIKTITIFSKSRSDPNKARQVDFIIYSNKIIVECSCQADNRGINCKHKTAFIMNDISMCFDDHALKQLEKLHLDPNISILKNRYEAFRSELHEVEKEKKMLTNEINRIKRAYNNELRDGVPII